MNQILEWNRRTATWIKDPDGAFTTFWRILLRFPEVLAWQNLWAESRRQMYRDIYGVAKACNPDRKPRRRTLACRALVGRPLRGITTLRTRGRGGCRRRWLRRSHGPRRRSRNAAAKDEALAIVKRNNLEPAH